MGKSVDEKIAREISKNNERLLSYFMLFVQVLIVIAVVFLISIK